MRFRLVPRDEGFFALFNKTAENAAAVAALVHEALGRLPDVAAVAEKVLELEDRGDQLRRQIFTALDTAIVTPLDREDIHALAEGFDRAVDSMSAAVDLIRLHQVSEPVEGVAEFGQLLVAAADAAVRATANLERLRDMQADLEIIDDIETRGDHLFRETTALLFSGAFKAFTVLKWKDVVESLEAALNAFESTADVITSIALKHS